MEERQPIPPRKVGTDKKRKNWIQKYFYTVIAVLLVVLLVAGVGGGLYFFITSNMEEEPQPVVTVPDASQLTFQQFTDEVFRQWMEEDTIDRHYTVRNPNNFGIQQEEAVLRSETEEAKINYYKQLHQIKDQLETYQNLSEEEQLIYDVFHAYLETELKAENLYLYEDQLSPLTGAQSQLPIFLCEYSFSSIEDIDEYLQVCSKIPQYFTEIAAFQNEKSKAGLFMSDTVLEEIIAQCEQFISDADNHMLISAFNEKINAMALEDRVKQDYIEKNEQAVTKYIIPAYQNLISALKALKGTGTNQGGLCNFTQGKEYYEYLVAANTGCSLSVDEIKKKIASQVYEDLSHAAALIEQDSGIAETAAQAVYPSADPNEILSELQQKIAVDFPELGQTSYEVKYINPVLQDYLSPAFYLSPPIDETNNNVIYINANPKYDLTKIYPTIAHEGYPGHLYQIVYFRQNCNNNLRKILNFPGYTEGWAVYTEQLSYDMMDTLSEMVRSYLKYCNSATLGIHALMDIGIHYEGWDMEKIKTYITNYFGDVGDDVVTEIYYNIVEDPANYLSYYVGYLQFLDLRDQAENSWGNSFTAKEFHQKILDIGPAPFDVIESYLFRTQ